MMHDGMQYDLIQGQGQDHEPLKVESSVIFKGYLSSFIMGAGKWPRILKLGAIPKAYRGRIFYFCPIFCVT